jgi:glycosyltransferase involved in cell wall biosynthesis
VIVRRLVLIPAYNEAGSLPALVASLRVHLPGADILVVDDASCDGTAALLPQLGVLWIRLSQRLGTGAAVRTGLRYAATLGCDIVIRIDGDGQHPPQEIHRLLAPLEAGESDVVIGSRYAEGRPGWTPPSRWLLHRTLASILTLVTGRPVTDPTSGFWAFGSRALHLLVDHHPSGYPEPELLLFLSRNSLRVLEVPVAMRSRTAGRTSLTPQRIWGAMARLLLVLVVVPLRAAVGSNRE